MNHLIHEPTNVLYVRAVLRKHPNWRNTNDCATVRKKTKSFTVINATKSELWQVASTDKNLKFVWSNRFQFCVEGCVGIPYSWCSWICFCSRLWYLRSCVQKQTRIPKSHAGTFNNHPTENAVQRLRCLVRIERRALSQFYSTIKWLLGWSMRKVYESIWNGIRTLLPVVQFAIKFFRTNIHWAITYEVFMVKGVISVHCATRHSKRLSYWRLRSKMLLNCGVNNLYLILLSLGAHGITYRARFV